jgi:hypothetical protein
MAFAIQWTGPIGTASTQHKDQVDALRYAMQMLGKGYADLVIVDLPKTAKRRRTDILFDRQIVRDSRLANLLKILVVLICVAAILQRLLPALGVSSF